MKKLYSLIAILVAIFFAQNVYAATDVSADKLGNPWQENGTWWYTGKYNTEHNVRKEGGVNVYLNYPSDYIWFSAYTGATTTDENQVFHIDMLYSSGWSQDYSTARTTANTKWQDLSAKIDPAASAFRFRNSEGGTKRLVNNLKVRMAGHAVVNTPSLTFSKTPVKTTQELTIDFKSFMSCKGMTIYFIDKNGNETSFNNQLTMKIGSSSTATKHTIGNYVLEKTNENNNNITVYFTPQSLFKETTDYKVRIRIKREDNSYINTDVPLKLSSAPLPPTLKLDEVGYTYAKISWSAVTDVEKYYLYDNGTYIGTYTTTATTITGLNYGSNHKYTVTSVYGSAESKHSNAVTANCPAYPKVQNVRFTSIGTNHLTAQWDPVTISPANHAFVIYHVHFYQPEAGLGPGVGYTTTNTSFTFNDLVDVTRYTVYVDVEYKYTLNGSTTNVGPTGSNWTSASTTTASFVPATAFDDVAIYQGEWYRVNAGISHEMGIGAGCEIKLKEYPCENLKYKAWVEKEGNGGDHFISEDATNIEYQLSGDGATYLEGNKFQTPVKPIKPEYTNIKFQSRRWLGSQKIYVSDMYAKITPHIKIKSNAYIENALYPYIPFGKIRLDGGSVSATVNFQSFLVYNELKVTSSNPKFKLSKSVIAPATTSKAGTFCKQGETEYDFTITFTPDELGSHNSRITITDGVNTIAFTVDATVYSKNRLHVAGDWNNSANWFFGIPASTEEIEIAAATNIPNSYSAVAEDITILSGGSITIAPQGSLKVNTINGANSSNLVLQADANGAAKLLYKNTNKVDATLQQYFLASADSLRNNEPGNFKDPKWQYIGIVAENVAYSTLNADGTTNWMYIWDETKGGWASKLKSGNTLSAWNGYCIAQKDATTYTYAGTLINSDHTYTLTYTAGSVDTGNNLITNSYAAPIDITTLSKDDNFQNAEAKIFIYNAGSYNEWKQNATLEGFAPGQFIAIPVNSSVTLREEYPRTIASGQAFVVKAKEGGGTFSINYDRNVYNATQTNNIKRAKRNQIEDFNVLRIKVVGETSNDRLYLLEHTETTSEYDNGYDAEKIFDNPNGPQIYATTSFGQASINSDASFINQYIGFVANDENELYTISFDIENLHSYNNLFLYDTETDIYVDILAEETYQFYGSTIPNDSRFLIITREDAPSHDTTTSLEIITWEDLANLNETVHIYTTTGQLINIVKPNTTYQNTLPTGVYIIKYNNKTLKMINK